MSRSRSLRAIRGPVAGAVSKAGPTGFGLVRRLAAEGLPAQVIATSKVLAPAGPEGESDRRGCRRLVLIASRGMLHPIRVPTEQDHPQLRWHR